MGRAGRGHIRADAAGAGLPLAIDTKDGEQTLDFHSLRGSYATILDGLDISLKARPELLRHSDPRLTMNRYTGFRVHDLEAVADRLPSLSAGDGTDREPSVLRATGTNDGPRFGCPPSCPWQW